MSISFYRWTLLSLCIVSTAQAAVLLEKVTLPGEVLPGYDIRKNCVIQDSGQLVIQYQLSGMNSKRTMPLQLSKPGIKIKIDEAATGTITSEIIPVDVATIIYRTYQKQIDGTIKTVLLYEENGGSGEKKINNSQAATALRNFIDVNCGDELRYQ